MSVTASSREWSPKMDPGRPADITEYIHRIIAWIYAVFGALGVVIALSAGSSWGALLVGAIIGGVVALHAALSVGARNRRDVAKVGSFIVGVLMLVGFPIGTITGGVLIYNAIQPWPPRRVASAATGGVDMRDL